MQLCHILIWIFRLSHKPQYNAYLKGSSPLVNVPPSFLRRQGKLHPSLPWKCAPPPAISVTHQSWLGVCLMNPMICCHPSALVCHHWSCSKHTDDIVLLSTTHLSALSIAISLHFLHIYIQVYTQGLKYETIIFLNIISFYNITVFTCLGPKLCQHVVMSLQTFTNFFLCWI